MERYEAYKDSGVEWIGEIPVGWKTARMGTSCYLKGRIGWQGLKAEEFIDDGPYLVTGTDFCNGRVNWKTCYHISQDRFEEAPEIHVRNGDLLITKDGTIGKVALICDAPNAVSLNSHLLLMRPLDGQIDSRFLFWVLSGEEFSHYTDISQSGTIMASLSQDKIARFIYALPSVVEQQAIADYLDVKTAEIDGLVADCEREVELLQEYRKAVISEAVTKGLDPNVPMKDSDVEWIGEIPEGWQVRSFKGVGQVVANLQRPQDHLGLVQVAPDRIEKGTGRLLPCVTVEEAGVESDNHLFATGDILYSKVRPALNKVTVATFDGMCSADIYPIKTSENAHWLMYYMLSSAFVGQVVVSTDRVKMPKINKEELGVFKVILPPLVEQQAIVAYLDAKTAAIDSLIDSKRQMIEKLREYRKSFISEAVTGKFKVPGV